MASRNAGPANSDNVVVKPFKYRSINDDVKIQILEQNREQDERRHFQAEMRLRILRDLPPVEDQAIMNHRLEEIRQLEDSCAIWGQMIDKYNEQLLELRETRKVEDE